MNRVDATSDLRDQPAVTEKTATQRCFTVVPAYHGPLNPRRSQKGYATMASNVGMQDRVVRIVAGIVLVVLAYLQLLPGIATIIMYVLAAYLLLSGLFARCIFYKMVDVDTTIQEQPYSTTDDRAGL